MKYNSGKHYYTFSEYLKKSFGGRVYKIGVDAGFGCPNRNGDKGSGGCIFCSNRAFSSSSHAEVPELAVQIENGMAALGRKYGESRYMLYFQSNTNTYGPTEKLKEKYDIIYRYPDIVALSIGTRPDTVDELKLDMIAGYAASGYETWIEYGLQTVNDRILHESGRNHSYADFLNAVDMTRKRPELKICAHVIIGLPGENPADTVDTAKEIARLKLEGVKIHPLHVVRGTELEEVYTAGSFDAMTMEEYIDRVAVFLKYLHPGTVIQRLTADCDPEYLLAPGWINSKNRLLSAIDIKLEEDRIYQGMLY